MLIYYPVLSAALCWSTEEDVSWLVSLTIERFCFSWNSYPSLKVQTTMLVRWLKWHFHKHLIWREIKCRTSHISSVQAGCYSPHHHRCRKLPLTPECTQTSVKVSVNLHTFPIPGHFSANQNVRLEGDERTFQASFINETPDVKPVAGAMQLCQHGHSNNRILS